MSNTVIFVLRAGLCERLHPTDRRGSCLVGENARAGSSRPRTRILLRTRVPEECCSKIVSRAQQIFLEGRHIFLEGPAQFPWRARRSFLTGDSAIDARAEGTRAAARMDEPRCPRATGRSPGVCVRKDGVPAAARGASRTPHSVSGGARRVSAPLLTPLAALALKTP